MHNLTFSIYFQKELRHNSEVLVAYKLIACKSSRFLTESMYSESGLIIDLIVVVVVILVVLVISLLSNVSVFVSLHTYLYYGKIFLYLYEIKLA